MWASRVVGWSRRRCGRPVGSVGVGRGAGSAFSRDRAPSLPGGGWAGVKKCAEGATALFPSLPFVK